MCTTLEHIGRMADKWLAVHASTCTSPELPWLWSVETMIIHTCVYCWSKRIHVTLFENPRLLYAKHVGIWPSWAHSGPLVLKLVLFTVRAAISKRYRHRCFGDIIPPDYNKCMLFY
jgi:hypothetical protein